MFMHDPELAVEAVRRIEAIPNILEVVCRTTGLGFAAVARVTEDRWIACSVRDEINLGLEPGGELKVETTICNEVRRSGHYVCIDDVAKDEVFRCHPTLVLYGFQSYIAVPIIVNDGQEFFGTLCAIDPAPARLNRPEIIEMLRLFADLIGFHLEAQDRVARTEAELLDERGVAELREQFISVLGHDLRSPLAAIDAGVALLRTESLSPRAISVVEVVQRSVGHMTELIDNVLDLARGRLGGGLALDRQTTTLLRPVLEQVIAEARNTWPNRRIESTIDVDVPVHCDRARVAQLLSNLLGNALAHGSPEEPVRVRAFIEGGVLELSVSNRGEVIPPNTIERLFQPFFRVAHEPRQQGLGLGLYIVSEIARAHDGEVDVWSTPDETRFTFRMPVEL